MCGKNNHADIDSRFDGNGAHTHSATTRQQHNSSKAAAAEPSNAPVQSLPKPAMPLYR